VAVDSEVTLWATAISSNADNDRKIIFRYAEAFEAGFERRLKPVRIIIAWRYESETGQPVAEDHQRMIHMEDSLESAHDQSSLAILALVSTGENLRESIYYAKSEDEFMARLNFALTDLPRFPIEIQIAHDPNWETYERFRSSMKKETIN
jgi:hypothetical protein